ncbi:MAG: ribonuclease H-like domain-containing protein [Candidatus Dormibacteraeota bacterium]|nr:ribonuclease H-like domain-containing protein [Candidatus Dormibacteraeota bacterium]MBV9526351.1 ribonuclease H-like domain-containing protein [Candidatus Dormibacteraeota bacterium]
MRCAAAVRAGELGFAAEPGPWGDFHRRSVTTDLAEFLEPAGLWTMPAGERLALLDARLAGERRSAGPVRVLDIEAVSVASGHLAAFLVGVGTVNGLALEVEQFLLADLAAEAALLLAVATRVQGSFLLTYNGRAFDMRILGSRCVANGIHPASVEPRAHLDLLASTRRLFRDQLRSCTLRQAELRLLRYSREADVPGLEGPGRYRAWLRGAPPDVLAGVVEHNRLDLCGTAALAARLALELDGEPTHLQAAPRYNL